MWIYIFFLVATSPQIHYWYHRENILLLIKYGLLLDEYWDLAKSLIFTIELYGQSTFSMIGSIVVIGFP